MCRDFYSDRGVKAWESAKVMRFRKRRKANTGKATKVRSRRALAVSPLYIEIIVAKRLATTERDLSSSERTLRTSREEIGFETRVWVDIRVGDLRLTLLSMGLDAWKGSIVLDSLLESFMAETIDEVMRLSNLSLGETRKSG